MRLMRWASSGGISTLGARGLFAQLVEVCGIRVSQRLVKILDQHLEIGCMVGLLQHLFVLLAHGHGHLALAKPFTLFPFY